ncbi:MAG: arginase [Proteobacteria bacterium]|nr:arginase [Pseudomonadota bacterium]
MTARRDIDLIGIPLEAGAGRRGCVMGPDAYRTAGLAETLAGLGHTVADRGNIVPGEATPVRVTGNARNAAEVAAWTRAIDAAGAATGDRTPIFMGGDHSLSAGSINAMARRAQAAGRPLFALWLDAHADFNTPATSPSGNIHGMPVAALTGAPGLDFLFDGLERAVLPPQAFHMFGIRSVDAVERRDLRARGLNVIDMRQIDEQGTARLMAGIIGRAAEAGAMLHVSLDVDFLDPDAAPAVGTTVPGGATFREAHLVMEMLADSALVTSLDLVELNPFMDHAGKSARLMVDLVASLFGRTIMER